MHLTEIPELQSHSELPCSPLVSAARQTSCLLPRGDSRLNRREKGAPGETLVYKDGRLFFLVYFIFFLGKSSKRRKLTDNRNLESEKP